MRLWQALKRLKGLKSKELKLCVVFAVSLSLHLPHLNPTLTLLAFYLHSLLVRSSFMPGGRLAAPARAETGAEAGPPLCRGEKGDALKEVLSS